MALYKFRIIIIIIIIIIQIYKLNVHWGEDSDVHRFVGHGYSQSVVVEAV